MYKKSIKTSKKVWNLTKMGKKQAKMGQNEQKKPKIDEIVIC